MNITKTNVDALNAVLTVAVSKADYADRVQKVLADYRKNANIPGFRKGTVPTSLIQRQYGKAVLLDEVNKILQESLNTYLTDENIEILGNPLPKVNENFDWDAEDFEFEFELGLVPEFSVDFKKVSKVNQFVVMVDDKILDKQVERIQKQYGKLISKEVVEEGDDVKGTFFNEEKSINSETTISLNDLKNKTVFKKFLGKKVGEVVTVSTKGLFADDHKLMDHLELDHDGIHDLDVDVQFTINAISTTEKAELNQDLLDKLFGPGVLTSLEEVKAKIKDDAEKQFAQEADQKFMNDVIAHLIDETPFDLPKEFLIKWLQTAGEKPLTAEQAAQEYDNSEKGLRYQLIEGKIMKDFNLKITFEDLKNFISDKIRKQMAQFGQFNPSPEDVEGIVARIMSNQEEVKRLSEQLMSEKMLSLYKTEINAKAKEVSYEQFVKEMYGE